MTWNGSTEKLKIFKGEILSKKKKNSYSLREKMVMKSSEKC
jgi:hypothetical protein